MASDRSFPVAFVRGYHVLKIDGYSRTFYNHKQYCSALLFESGSFYAGGHTWMMGHQDFNYVYLYLADDVVTDPVKVTVMFSIVDHDRNSKEYIHVPTLVTFSQPGDSHGIRIARTELTRRDCFVVRVDLFIVKEEKPSMSVVLPPSDMRHHLGALLSRQEHTDVEFRLGVKTFAAHRLLLGARSPVFKAKLFDDNPETTATIQVDDMEPQVFKAMLHFIYTDAWPKVAIKKEPAMSQRLLVAAGRYGMQRLKSMCEYRLCNHIDLNSVEDILLLAEKHQCAALKEACLDFIGSTATLLTAQENILAFRSTREPRFDHLVSLCPTITEDQIFNVLDESDHEGAIRGIDITLDIE